jgi:DNA-binding transcriptional MocR family regulator
MFALLDRANNDDCTVPHWLAPSIAAVEHDTGLAHSTVVTALAHLEKHGWLRREGQKCGQVAKTKQSGRLKSTTRWSLFPDDFVPGDCSCPKPDRSSHGQSGSQIVRRAANLDRSAAPIVSAGQTPGGSKGLRDEGSKGEGDASVTCIGCGRKPRRACRTCWDCSALEISDGRLTA